MGWSEWEWLSNTVTVIQWAQVAQTILILYAIRMIKTGR